VQEWTVETLRGFGQTGPLFSFETGRKCSTGPGLHFFEVKTQDDLSVALSKHIQESRDLSMGSEYAHLAGGGTLAKGDGALLQAPRAGEYSQL
jgi:hypothetical protein